MVQPYNLTAMQGQTNLYGFMTAANDVSGNLFGHLTLVVSFLIMIMAWRGYDFKQSFAGASFITALLSIFLRIMQWIPDKTMFTCFIIAGLSFVIMKWG